jgi:hypothetical protein
VSAQPGRESDRPEWPKPPDQEASGEELKLAAKKKKPAKHQNTVNKGYHSADETQRPGSTCTPIGAVLTGRATFFSHSNLYRNWLPHCEYRQIEHNYPVYCFANIE